MILLILLRVVLDEFLDVDLDEVDLGEDFVGGGGPGERLGVAVPVGYVGFTRTRKASVSDKERARLSANLLEQGHDNPFRSTHVGHPHAVLVLADAADEPVPVHSQLIDDRLEVADLE